MLKEHCLLHSLSVEKENLDLASTNVWSILLVLMNVMPLMTPLSDPSISTQQVEIYNAKKEMFYYVSYGKFVWCLIATVVG